MGRAWGNLWTGVPGSTCKTGAPAAGRAHSASGQGLCPGLPQEPGPQEADQGVASFSSLGLDTYSGPFCQSVLVTSRRPMEGDRGRTCPSLGERERERTQGYVRRAADPSRALRVAEGAPSPPSIPSSSLLAYKVTGMGLDLVPHGVLSASRSPTLETWLHVSPLPLRELWVFRALPRRTSWWPLRVPGGAASRDTEAPRVSLA